MRENPRYVQEEPTNIVNLHGPNGSREELVLPSGKMSILECSRKAFSVFAKTNRYFVRGRLITELGKDKKGNELLVQVKPSGLRTRLEEHFTLKAWRCAQKADATNGVAVGDSI